MQYPKRSHIGCLLDSIHKSDYVGDIDFNSEDKPVTYLNPAASEEDRIKDLLQRMTIDEKFKLLSGKDMWSTSSVKRLNIQSFRMSDGPHGFRNAVSTYFPISKCRASTWNPDLSYKFGVALAEEVRANDYHMILGPGINIDRTPYNGRTFEYLTEDPYLNQSLVVPTVKGIQSQRIAACVKHYIANNQEHQRRKVNANISERALREIYLPGFKAAVEEGNAWSIMTSYNQTNGDYGCMHQDLLINKLHNEFGFEGFVVTDWWATADIEGTITEKCLNHGLNLEMPGVPGGFKKPAITQFSKKKLQKALERGLINETTINVRVSELLRVMFRVGMFDDPETLPKGQTNTPAHQALARQIAEEGIVLLKNDNNLLPLNKDQISNITLLGPNLDKAMAKGGGSATLKPPYEVTPLDGLKQYLGDEIRITTSDNEIEAADAVLLFLGLNHNKGNDTESHDRTSLQLPKEQQELLKHCLEKNPKTILVLINGSPVAFDGHTKVPAILEAWYAGQEAGTAIAKILFGDVNPSGKLPITFPKAIQDSPAHKSETTYPGVDLEVYYEEGIFVGYRHFNKYDLEPLFPFGHGLSYTSFEYTEINLSTKTLIKNETITVNVEIENSGDVFGGEVVQLYIQHIDPPVERPPKELKGFRKLFLDARSKGEVSFDIHYDDLAFFDEDENQWITSPGKYILHIGSSSEDIRLEYDFEVM